MTEKTRDKLGIEKRLFTVPETAQYLNISDRTIYNRIAKKAKKPFPIKPKRIGGSIRFDKRDIDSYLDSI